MDFPGDPKAANIPDEYMYGPALLVAPVSEQGATSVRTGTTTGQKSGTTVARASP
jgi:alpha-glucosidase (family GH31 glycosyl hydrolase)